ncbi:MAG: hypothetical protein FJ038_04450 [Chloroflexi bacterium]|nr:hypothetical protein [Chloroflexota bacterium]
MTAATMRRSRSTGSANELLAVAMLGLAAVIVTLVLAGAGHATSLGVDPSPAIGPSPQPAVVRQASPAPGGGWTMPAQPDPPLR